jgi:hypothetical protein
LCCCCCCCCCFETNPQLVVHTITYKALVCKLAVMDMRWPFKVPPFILSPALQVASCIPCCYSPFTTLHASFITNTSCMTRCCISVLPPLLLPPNRLVLALVACACCCAPASLLAPSRATTDLHLAATSLNLQVHRRCMLHRQAVSRHPCCYIPLPYPD